MKVKTMREAIAEANRFIDAAHEALDRQKKENNYRPLVDSDEVWYTRQSASARRASVDLSRKLSDLRAGR